MVLKEGSMMFMEESVALETLGTVTEALAVSFGVSRIARAGLERYSDVSSIGALVTVVRPSKSILRASLKMLASCMMIDLTRSSSAFGR